MASLGGRTVEVVSPLAAAAEVGSGLQMNSLHELVKSRGKWSHLPIVIRSSEIGFVFMMANKV